MFFSQSGTRKKSAFLEVCAAPIPLDLQSLKLRAQVRSFHWMRFIKAFFRDVQQLILEVITFIARLKSKVGQSSDPYRLR